MTIPANIETTTVQCKPSEAIEIAKLAAVIGKPLMLWGAPGIGKSQICIQIARWMCEQNAALRPRLDLVKRDSDLVKEIRMLMRNPVHFMGLPDIDKRDGHGRTYFSHPADIPTENELYVTLLLEELNLATSSVQALGYELALDRKIGDARLPEYMNILATGNMKKHRGATHEMPVPLRNRFWHVEIIPDRDDFISWCARNGIHPAVIAFARWKWELFNVMPGEKISVGSGSVTFDKDANSFPTNRSWAESVSPALHHGIPHGMETLALSSILGKPIATEFAGFYKIFRQLPNPVNIAMNPDSVNVPKEAATRWALSSALVSHVNESNGKNILKYLDKFKDNSGTVTQKEYAIFFVKAAAAKDNELQNTTWFNQFLADNSSIIF